MENTKEKEKAPFKYIDCKHFFEDYCPWVKNYKHKLRGKDGNKKPIEFSPEDRVYIRRGIKKMLTDLSK